MGALLEATVASPPSSIALNLTKDIHWIRVSSYMYVARILSHHSMCICPFACYYTVGIVMSSQKFYATIKMNKIMFGMSNVFILTTYSCYWVAYLKSAMGDRCALDVHGYPLLPLSCTYVCRRNSLTQVTLRRGNQPGDSWEYWLVLWSNMCLWN